MFDLNTIINAALNAAVQQAIAPLMERIENLDAVCQAQAERIEKLENNPAQGQDLTPITGLTRAQVEDLIEAAIESHCETYDHDSYDSAVSTVDDLPDFDDFVRDGDMPDFDDFVKSGDVEDAVRDAIGNLTFEVSVS